jgi:hypothetical protein
MNTFPKCEGKTVTYTLKRSSLYEKRAPARSAHARRENAREKHVQQHDG